MEKIIGKSYEGERPLFARNNLELIDVHIGAGESALKRCNDIVARKCVFAGKYPLWHSRNFVLDNCLFTPGGRAALWYSEGCKMHRCRVEAPKMFRRIRKVTVSGTVFTDAQETFWDCADVTLRDVCMHNCDYLFMHTDDIDIDRYEHHGNYSFQYCRNVVIRNARIDSKDSFWETENVTVYDSEINGEYLGWYSRNLTLVNCRISGTQPLCYIDGLTLINCTFAPDCDLAFEESAVIADIVSDVTSVKNPRHGLIKAPAISRVVIDTNVLPDSDCKIIVTD